jgi:hypothetical protein
MNKYSFGEAVDISNKITIGTNILISTAVTLVIGVILIKLFWFWTIPELFPTAVGQGLIVGDITWLNAFKITGLVAILTSTGSLVAGRWGRQTA